MLASLIRLDSYVLCSCTQHTNTESTNVHNEYVENPFNTCEIHFKDAEIVNHRKTIFYLTKNVLQEDFHLEINSDWNTIMYPTCKKKVKIKTEARIA